MGLTVTTQTPLSAVATIDADEQPVTDVWSQLFDEPAVADAFVRACREFAAGRSIPELYDGLADRSIPTWLRSRIRSVALGDRSEAWHLAADIVPGLGQGQSTTEDLFATAGLFDALDDSETIAFVIDQSFEDQDRSKRSAICRLITELAKGLDVRLVTSGVTRAFLADRHHDDLPGVSKWRGTDRDGQPLDEAVEQAIADLDPDGREVALLRALKAEPSETLAYSQLYGLFSDVGESRMRQVVDRLDDLGLVTAFGPQSNRKVELLETGRGVLDALDAEIGTQATLDEAVSETGKCSPQCRVTPRTGLGGEDGQVPWDTAWMSLDNHRAAAGCATAGSVTLVDSRVAAQNNRTHEVSHDPDNEEVVIAVRATGCLQYAVSSAVALATPWFLQDTLTDRRLDTIDEPPAILRDARCIGSLSDRALADFENLREELVDWGQTIQDLTTDLKNGDYEDRDALRATIIRSAHGLAGSIVHLLEAAGIDVVREVRVPSAVDQDNLEELAKSVSISAAIQSTYAGVHSIYRQLFEKRDEKRATSFSPTIDAEDPYGTLIGSFVVRGEDLHRLRPHLENSLEQPTEVHDDAPETAVCVDIREPTRSDSAAIMNRTLLPKRIRPTDRSIDITTALVTDPFAIATAYQHLGSEERPRDLRPDECRYALNCLDATDLCRDLPPTVGKMVSALLSAERRLTQSELADRAGVSTRSVRNNAAELEAIGLLDRSDGYRLRLSFQTTDERNTPVTPAIGAADSALDIADALLSTVLPPERYADPDDPLGGLLFWPQAPWQLATHDDLAPWFGLARRLAGIDQPADLVDDETQVQMGPAIAQRPLPSETEVAA